MLPLAPGLLSTITGWPRSSESLAPTVRAVMSEEPPAVNGTMMVIGRLGYDWAKEAVQKARAAISGAPGLKPLMVSPRQWAPRSYRQRPWSRRKSGWAKTITIT